MWRHCVRQVHSNVIPSHIIAYAKLPPLPNNKKLVISNIGVYNYNAITRTVGRDVTMELLNSLNKEAFSLIKGYTGFVSPVVIVDENLTAYRTCPHLWTSLTVMHDAILVSQGLFLKKVLPITTTVDAFWLCQLAEAIDFDIVEQLFRQRNLALF